MELGRGGRKGRDIFLHKIKKSRDNEQAILNKYKNTPAKEIWRKELEDLRTDYNKWLKNRETV